MSIGERISIFAGALLVLCSAGSLAENRTSRAPLEKFVDELPIPTVITAKPGMDLTIHMVQTQVKFHRDLPEQPAFTYNGTLPGPTIEVETGQFLRVKWRDELPGKHVFPAPAGAMGADLPDVKAVVHLHGAATPQPGITDRFHDNDGWPDLWLRAGEEQIAEYPNQQDARQLWYHDHAVGDTGRNVAAGLSGAYFIRDAFERSLGLPSGKFEIPLILQTQGIAEDGTRYYTNTTGVEFYGNSATVNGKLWPRLSVEPRKYRFRILNGANARSFAMKLLDEADDSDGPPLFQIGTDAGFLAGTATLNDPADPDAPRLLLAPAERADIIIDFSRFAGHKLVLQNNSLDPGDAEMPIPLLMRFDVGTSLSAPDESKLPTHIRGLPRMKEAGASNTRKIVFSNVSMSNGVSMMMLNNAGWTDPVTERPVLNSTEIWEIVNPLPDGHPFHVHLVNFQILDRRPLDAKRFLNDGIIQFTGDAELPDTNELGWKDVVRVPPRSVTRIIMKFAKYTGHYVYHCHILEHEDMDMMRPFEVVAP